MNRNLIYLRLIIILISLPFVYFGQLYPYLHFHHDHDEHGSKVVVSAHPVDQSKGNPAGHESTAHNDDVPEHLAGDRFYTQAFSRNAILTKAIFNESTAWIAESESYRQFLVSLNDDIVPQHLLYNPPDLPRGPPQLA